MYNMKAFKKLILIVSRLAYIYVSYKKANLCCFNLVFCMQLKANVKHLNHHFILLNIIILTVYFFNFN